MVSQCRIKPKISNWVWVCDMSKIKRPKPPNELIGFLPAFEIFDWVKKVFFDENSKLYNPDHEHLHDLETPELSFLGAGRIGRLS